MKNKPIIILAALLVLITVSIIGYQNFKGDTIEPLSASLETEEPSGTADGQAEETINYFMDNFIESAPGNDNQDATTQAISVLSEGAKSQMEDPTSSGDLARFVGVQDIPDQGYQILGITYKTNPATGEPDAIAEAEVALNYSGGDSIRMFTLSKNQDTWLIDTISLDE